jgi:hypothetical protein
MDASYEFDSERRVVIIAIHGELTDQGLLEGYDRLVGDPRFSSHYDELVDLRAATGGEVTAEGVLALVARPAEFAPTSRRAIVIRSDLGFGMARMYEILRGGEAGNVRVFRDLDAAKQWLRIR